MKNIKKLVATLGLLGIIIMTVSSANAGIVMHDRSATPTPPTAIERLLNSVRNTVIGQITGVTIQERTGIMFSD